jgi:hypothetical protein
MINHPKEAGIGSLTNAWMDCSPQKQNDQVKLHHRWSCLAAVTGCCLLLAACSSNGSPSSSGAGRTTTSHNATAKGTVAVPNVSGDSMEQAISSVQAIGLDPGGIYVDPTGPKTSSVLSTTPPKGALVPAGTKIVFNIGSGN